MDGRIAPYTTPDGWNLPPPSPDLKMTVIIPCLAEEDIVGTLLSLQLNKGFQSSVECIVLINHSESAERKDKEFNNQILAQLEDWCDKNSRSNLKFYALAAFDLPHQIAGVGLARKIGMDMAVQRFGESGVKDAGVIICLDGDCRVTSNYLQEIEKMFFGPIPVDGCSIYFEHPLNEGLAIVEYELFLRYYINGLRYSGFPFAFQTVGSCMSVRAGTYKKEGGMNTRKAGEDFYFLNKIIPLGKFYNLTSATVFPSGRVSNRVPFGTGRAMGQWLANRKTEVYHPQWFEELKTVFHQLEELRFSESLLKLLEQKCVHFSLINYLAISRFEEAMSLVRNHTASMESFTNRFFRWFNAFRIMRMLNELSKQHFPKMEISKAANHLWKKLKDKSQPDQDVMELLKNFRIMDKRDGFNATRP